MPSTGFEPVSRARKAHVLSAQQLAGLDDEGVYTSFHSKYKNILFFSIEISALLAAYPTIFNSIETIFQISS